MRAKGRLALRLLDVWNHERFVQLQHDPFTCDARACRSSGSTALTREARTLMPAEASPCWRRRARPFVDCTVASLD